MNGETKRKAPIFEPSTDRKILANLLTRKLVKEGGDFVSYSELSAAIGGRNVQGNARCLLNGARLDFSRDHHRLTVSVRNEGIRLSLDPSGCLEQKVKHIQRTARKGIKEAGHVMHDEKLAPEQRRGVLVQVAQFGAISQFATSKAAKQIEGKIDEKAPQELALLPTIDAVRSQFTNGKS